jgi:hypothetical protein
MSVVEPYVSAERGVFWIVDKTGQEASADRPPSTDCGAPSSSPSWFWSTCRCTPPGSEPDRDLLLLHLVERKVLTPNDFTDLAEVEARLLAFPRTIMMSGSPDPSSGSSPAPTSILSARQDPSAAHSLHNRGSVIAKYKYVTAILCQSTKGSLVFGAVPLFVQS